MANDSGVNQFAGFPAGPPIPYGDKKRQGALQRLAPLAGKPVPEVRRASQDEHRGQAAEAQPVPPGPADVPAASGPPPAELFAAIAAIPGASDTVRGIFGGQAAV